MIMLIADDELVIRKGLTSLKWDQIGIEKVIVAENGIQAKELIEKEEIDILLSDISMPGLSGLDLAEYIHDHAIDIAVVLLTGYSEFEYARKAIKHQVYDYILKPLRAKDIMNTISCTMERLEQNRFQKKLVEKQGDKNKQGDMPHQIEKCFYQVSPQVFDILIDIGKNYADDISLNELAEQHGFTNTYLSRLIKKETEYSFMEILTAIRLTSAIIYMRNDKLKITDICDKVGFRDQRYFSQVFRNAFHCTPSEFRKNAEMVDLHKILLKLHTKSSDCK